MAIVYPWPPVMAIAKSWNLDSPISKSYSMTTGKRYASSVKTPRRRVKVTVAGRRGNGIGYMAALERLLKGGVNFVRLSSCRMASAPTDATEELSGGEGFDWETPPIELSWETPPDSFLWSSSFAWDSIIVPTYGGRRLRIEDDNLPRGALLAVSGEFIRVITALNLEGEVHMITAPARVSTDPNSKPFVVLKLATPASGPGRIVFNSYETGIFEIVGQFPDLGFSGTNDPDISLEFREVFPEEVAEGLMEANAIWT